jgi:L-amino acid N-acyltransferase YncA
MSADNSAAGSLRIEPMTAEHAGQILAIYQAGLAEGDATFEVAAPSWPEFDRARLAAHRFIAVSDRAGASEPAVLGWVAVSPVSARPAYAGVVEHSVYVHPAARGTGIGRALMTALISSTEAAGIWTVQSGIFPENIASLALHQAAGFRVVGRRDRLGQRDGRWRDVLLLERRSPLVL